MLIHRGPQRINDVILGITVKMMYEWSWLIRVEISCPDEIARRPRNENNTILARIDVKALL